MTDRPLHTARRRLVLLGDGRIQFLGDCSKQIHIFNHHHDSIPQILISLDMRRNTNLMDDTGDLDFKITFLPGFSAGKNRPGILHLSLIRFFASRHLMDTFHQNIQIKRLHYVILRTQTDSLLRDLLLSDRRQHDDPRILFQFHIIDSFQNTQPVQMRHDHIEDQNIRLFSPNPLHCFQSVITDERNLDFIKVCKIIRQDLAKLLIIISNSQSYLLHGSSLPNVF